MKIDALFHKKFVLGLLGLIFAIALFLVGCQPLVDEKIPAVIAITNAPDLQRYVLEFSKPASREPIVAVSDRKEPVIPVDHSLIQGKVLSIDHNTNCSLWLIQSYVGSNWWEQQKVYVYSEKTKELRR